MGAEIVWSVVRSGPVRFGRMFRSAETHDEYSGCGTVEDHGEFCVIGPLGGKLSRQDHDDILECCAGWGFKHAKMTRTRKDRIETLVCDLLARPFKWEVA